MPNSYVLHTANGSTSDFYFSGIDGWLTSGFLKVYVNDVLQTTGFTFQDLTTAMPFVRFSPTVPVNNAIVRIQRETPATVATFKSNVVDYSDSSILTASDLNKGITGMLHVVQEADDTVENAIGLTLDQTNWDGDSRRLTNLDDGMDAQDAATVQQLQTTALYGGAAVVPQVWAFTGTGGATYALSPAPLNLTEEMFIVEVGGVIQNPSTYTITTSNIVFDANVASGVTISVRNFGVSRNLNESVSTAMLENLSVTTAKIAATAVDDTKLASNAVTTAKVANDAITYAKIQNVSATDRILGRSSAGAGDIQEITCTAAGRNLIDDATVGDQRNTLGLGGLAVLSQVADANVAATANISFSKLQTVAANSLLGNNTAGAAVPVSVGASAVATMLGLSTLSSWNTNRVGAINLMYGTGLIATTATLGSSAVTNASALVVGNNSVVLTAQSLTSAFEVTGNTSIRPTSGTGGTWFVLLSRTITVNNWVAIALRTA